MKLRLHPWPLQKRYKTPTLCDFLHRLFTDGNVSEETHKARLGRLATRNELCWLTFATAFILAA